jgi:hypothetical protein
MLGTERLCPWLAPRGLMTAAGSLAPNDPPLHRSSKSAPERRHRLTENFAPSRPVGARAGHRSASKQIAGHRANANLAFRRRGAPARAGSVHAFDVKCLGAQTRAARGDPRRDIQPYAFRGEARLRHRTRRLSPYRGWRIEDFTGDGAQSVEIGLCEDRHTSPKRTRRAAFAGRVTAPARE